MKALPGWKHPYDLMPGYPFGTQGYPQSVMARASDRGGGRDEWP